MTQSAFRLYTVTPLAPASAYEFQSSRTNYTVTLSYRAPAFGKPLLYAKSGTGYRAGGINPGVSSPFAPVPFRPTYGNEDTTSYELGLKGDLGRHIYYTLAGHVSRTTNAIATINDGCAVTNACGQGATIFNINAGAESSHGVEGSVQANYEVAGGRLNLLLTGANQEATYVAVRGTYAGLPILGSTVAQQPDYTASGVLDYLHPLTSSLDGFLNVTWNGQWGGGQDTVTAAQPLVSLYDFNMVSLRTGVNWGRTQLAFSCRTRGQAGLEAPYATDQLAEGELGEVLAAGYAHAVGVFGAHRFFHAPGDDLRCTDPALTQAAARGFRAFTAEALRRPPRR